MWTKLKRFSWEWRGVWITAPAITAIVLILRFYGLLQAWEWAAFDQYFRLRPLEIRDDRIVIVGIDETDMRKIGQAPIPDGVYARLIEKIKAQRPRAIGLDIYRDIPVEPGHKQLLRTFASTPNLIGIQKVVGEINREAVAPPPLLKAKGQVGANDLIFDADNKVRRGLLYVTGQNQETVYSLSLYLALLYLEAEHIEPQEIEGTKNWQLGKTLFAPFTTNDGGYVQADDRGYQLLLNYRGPSRYFDTISITDVLEDRLPPGWQVNWGRDRIILIGAVGESFKDLFFTPYSSGMLTLPEPVAGVEIHANLTSQILSAAMEGRPLISSWSEPVEWLWILFWAGIGASLTWRLRYAGGVRSISVPRVISLFLAGGTLLGSTYVAFLGGWWIPVIPPFLALIGAAGAITTYVARTAQEIRKTFGRYLTDQVVSTLLESPDGLKLGGERRKITILTSDIRGFTAISERLPAEEVIKIINLYLSYMADIITQYEGTIDEFMGDGILVLFGAPTSKEDDASRAVACAIAAQLAMGTVNEKMAEFGLLPLEMGIGINTGEVVVGNIGSEKRAKYGVVGSQVNLTYRIESYTIGGQILISESTYQEVASIVKIKSQREVQPKGVKQPITIYEVLGIGGKYNLALPQAEEMFFPLPEAVPIQYMLLDGKHISDVPLQGSLTKLSTKGALVSLSSAEQQSVPSPLSNIKLNLLRQNGTLGTSEDAYAKVLEKSAEQGTFFIHFTNKPQDVEVQLNALYQLLET